MQGLYDRGDAEAERSRKVRKSIEITFIDGTKVLHLAETWDEFRFREDGILQMEYQGQAFAWYVLRNIKSMVVLTEEDIV